MIKRFNRYEIKYTILASKLQRLIADLVLNMDRDPYVSGAGFYRISSLYFDTPGLDCYWNKLDGLLFRRKLRIRIYPDRPKGPAFVEIKQRVNRTVQKRRLAMDLKDAYALCSGRPFKLSEADDQAVADEVHYLVTSLRLAPKNVISYSRQAFVGRFVDAGLRLTFDTLVKARWAGFDLHQQNRRMMIAYPPNQAIMEVKANERVPHWLVNTLARHQCTLTRVSKYCQGIAQIQTRLQSGRVQAG
ncbi:MAG: VTC domain-containing protein [Planctomycetota bacterium]|jgi:SPX domain protein involved in polyphosphate accumulation